MDADSYCRDVEAHLCRRNAGHLVRIVGPAFEMVAGWAARGVPLKVVLRGIDTCVERRAAKGPSRRPVRIEFCEADVLDGFDQWRRAVGIGTAGLVAASGQGVEPEAEHRVKAGFSLRAHLDRVAARLTDRVASGGLPASLEAVIDQAIVDLAPARDASRRMRGDARAELIAALGGIDARVMAAAQANTPADRLAEIGDAAAGELSGFAGRMPADAFARAVAAASQKLLREYWKLPEIGYGV